MIRLRFLALLIVTSLLDVVSLSQINNPDNSVNLLSSWILADNSASSTLMPTSDLRKSEAANIESLGTLEALTTDLDNQNNCQLTQVIHILKHAGCHPKEIQSYACSGSCPSYVQVSIVYLYLNNNIITILSQYLVYYTCTSIISDSFTQLIIAIYIKTLES